MSIQLIGVATKPQALKGQFRIKPEILNLKTFKKLKEVIILYEFEDFSYEKIAQKLKIPQGTVKSRINTARKILQERLRPLTREEN